MEDDILQEFLAESWENLGRLDTEIVSLEKDPNNTELLASIFRTIHTIKGTCGFIGLTGLGSVAHSAEKVLAQMREGSLNVTPGAISLVLDAVDEIKQLLGGLEATGQEPAKDNSGLIARLEKLAASIGGAAPATVQSPVAAAAAPVMPSPQQPSGRARQNAEAGRAKETGGGIADLSIRVNIDVLDSLMNLVGELVLTRNQLLQLARGDDESKYATPISHLNRVTTDLQEGVMKTRMQPIGNAWSKLPRLVRDLSQVTGKAIELEMSGAETELDRTVLDAIKDPLTHMVRNSADHGVESSEQRRAAGKSECGKIKLNAYHEGGHVIICIEDDGAGINAEKVLRKAIANGWVSEAEAATLSDSEILNFIFKPGLSTAEQVSSVSGRGVGMDVVRTAVEKIGGTIDISSKPGVGTAVRIKIPLTLAIISALVVEAGGQSFAIPQLGVVELVRLAVEDKGKIERIHDNEVFRLRDRLLPLVYLDEALELKPASQSAERDIDIVVVQVGDEQFGLIVDGVFDTEEIVVKPVGSLLKNINIYQGTTILGDGRVIMILDVAGIASQFGGISANASEKESAREAEVDHDGDMTSLLLFDAGSGATMSVPLSLVARLEEFPRETIETSGERQVVQYRGDLLPLLPLNGAGSANEAPNPQPVIVFSEGKQSLGLMVHAIQDILEERLVIRMQSQRPGVLGTAIINGKATDVIDTQFYITRANPNWFVNKDHHEARKVLVVDDSMFFRQLVRTALESEHFRVTVVASAVAAVELFERGARFDVVISDMDMPMMDGFEFAEWLRSRPDTKNVPLIALTSLSAATHEERAREVGFTRYLNKFNAQQLINTIEELSQHATIRQGVCA